MEALQDLWVPWSLHAVPPTAGLGPGDLGEGTFEGLDIIRVYSRKPRKEPGMSRLFVLPGGLRIEDLAEDLQYPKVAGPSAFDDQSVQGGHGLEAGYLVELHT